MKGKIGFYGYPPEEVLISYIQKGYEFIDLDIDYNKPDTALLPAAGCQIIKNIINNAFYYKNDIELIIATVGEDKCDSGRFAAMLLRDYGFNVLFTSNMNKKPRAIKICDSDLSLKDKINRVMDGILDKNLYKGNFNKVEPSFGFWGVPPNDFDILELFPDDTVVLGWVRCVEAGVPADLELEAYVPEGLKTVFFTQSFCAKGMLAKNLAEKHEGLYIDLERFATHSIKAKIEAFLRLS